MCRIKVQNPSNAMKILKESFVSRTKLLKGALVALLLTGFVVQSEAQIYTLSQNGSSVQVNLGGGGTNGFANVSDWLVDGVNQLNQQWFYYRVGPPARKTRSIPLPVRQASLFSPAPS